MVSIKNIKSIANFRSGEDKTCTKNNIHFTPILPLPKKMTKWIISKNTTPNCMAASAFANQSC